MANARLPTMENAREARVTAIAVIAILALSAVDRLKITSADTLLWKMGCDAGESPACAHLATDYLSATRPTPVSIGALDVPP